MVEASLGLDLEELPVRLRELRRVLAGRRYFRRTPQPWSFPMERHIVGSILIDEPLRGILFWGAGSRAKISNYEQETLDFVCAALAAVAVASRCDVSLTLILADAHAEENGYKQEAVYSYLEEVGAHAAARGASAIRLSEILRGVGFQARQILAPPLGIINQAWEALPKSLQERLIRDAGKVAASIGVSPESAARRYAGAAELEAALLTRVFSGSFLVSFSPPDLAVLLPSLPTIFMFTNERRETLRPWFR